MISFPTTQAARQIGSAEHHSPTEPAQQKAATARAGLIRDLALAGTIDGYSQLVPLDALQITRDDIEASLAPAADSDVENVTGTLVSSFKCSPEVLANPQGFAVQMRLALSSYPPDVLYEIIPRAVRAFDWLPSIKQVLDIADQLCGPRRRALHTIDQMKAEHGRRKIEADRRAERELQHRAWLAELTGKLAEMFGEDAPLPDDIELACALRPNICLRQGTVVSWLASLAGGELWAAKFCRQLAVLARLNHAFRLGKAPGELAREIAELIVDDEADARRQIEGIEIAAVTLDESQTEQSVGFDLEFAIIRIEASAGLDQMTGRLTQNRNRLAAVDLAAISPRRLGEVLAELQSFKLPDADDPRVLRMMAEMGE